MIEIHKEHKGKTLRIFIEDGGILISSKDLGSLINDHNPARRLERVGIVSSRYHKLVTNGGVQNMRLVTPRECAAVIAGLRSPAVRDELCSWLSGVMSELAGMKRDFCGEC